MDFSHFKSGSTGHEVDVHKLKAEEGSFLRDSEGYFNCRGSKEQRATRATRNSRVWCKPVPLAGRLFPLSHLGFIPQLEEAVMLAN